MQAYRWMMTEPGAPLVREAFDPFPPAAGEAVVEVAGCGVCHTDLGYYFDGVRTNHALPLALGHEISGRVVATGEGASQWQGAAVIVPAVIPCGSSTPAFAAMARKSRTRSEPCRSGQGSRRAVERAHSAPR